MHTISIGESTKVRFADKEAKTEYVENERKHTFNELMELYRAVTPKEREAAKDKLYKKRMEFYRLGMTGALRPIDVA